MPPSLDEILRSAAEDPEVISFAGGLPAPELFPRDGLLGAATKLLRIGAVDGPLQYAWPEGEASLRDWVVRGLRARGASVDPEQVIITAGAQQALSLSAELLIADGDAVRIDPVSYPGAIDEFRSRGAVLSPSRTDVVCAYVMPGVSNPRGDDPVTDQLDELLALGCPLITDEAYAELRFDGTTVPALLARAPDRVFHIGTVSKTLCPGLRVGWLVAPPGRVDELRHRKQRCDLQTATFSQALLVELLRTDSYDGHIKRARSFYADRATRLVAALHEAFPHWTFVDPGGGFSVYVTTDLCLDEVEMLEKGRKHGVVWDPGSVFSTVAPADHRLRLRLCYSTLDSERARTGLRRLQTACRTA